MLSGPRTTRPIGRSAGDAAHSVGVETNDRAALAALPRVDTLLEAAGDVVDRHGRGPATEALRRAVDDARARLLAGETSEPPAVDALVAAAEADLTARRPGPPRPVVNAAGVVVHTNLGRAPLSEQALEAMAGASGYCDLEYDLATGRRGSRTARLEPLLADACHAEAGLAVNNAAGALVLVLAALAAGRQVPVSRGELVEIGGSFRLPDIMAASAADLREVGTTNRTRASDYEVDGDVALLLRVHRSNYEITGFTQQPTTAELAQVARARGVPLVYDVGSGLLAEQGQPWQAAEPSVQGALAEGADLVLCSGDKLLGGPQAGLIAGRSDLVEACRAHPLARALRLDKLRIAALVATLESHLRGARDELPVWAALDADAAELRQRATALAQRVGGVVVDDESVVGGGSAPGALLPSPVVRRACADPGDVAARLRQREPPIVVRVGDEAVWVDLRTVPADHDDLVGERLLGAVQD